MILISAATILAQNVYRPLAKGASDHRVSMLARSLVPILTLVAVLLTLRGGSAIVNLLLMGYNLVTQLFPAVILSIGPRRMVTTAGAFAGILAGEAMVAYIALSGTSVATLLPWASQVVKDLNVGIVALIVNVVVLTLVTLATRERHMANA